MSYQEWMSDSEWIDNPCCCYCCDVIDGSNDSNGVGVSVFGNKFAKLQKLQYDATKKISDTKLPLWGKIIFQPTKQIHHFSLTIE